MNYYFFVFIFLSQEIFGLSELQFDRMFNENYHSKARHVSARLQESLETLKIYSRTNLDWDVPVTSQFCLNWLLAEPSNSPVSKRMKHLSFDTGDAFQNLSLMLMKLANRGNRQPWKFPRIGRKWNYLKLLALNINRKINKSS